VIVIDATANEILAFSRECFVPWIDSRETGDDKTTSFKNKFGQTVFDAIHDEATAHATLASTAMLMSNATGNRSTRLYAHRLASSAYASLQKHVQDPSSSSDSSIPMRIFTLFVFEYMAGNRTAASVHCQALQNVLLERRRTGQEPDPVLISAAFWHDTYRALLFKAQPVLDTVALLDQALLREVDGFATRLEYQGIFEALRCNGAEATGVPPRVQQLFARITHLLRVGGSFCRAAHLMGSTTMNSFAHNVAIVGTKIHTLLHDAWDRLAAGPSNSQLLHREAATALAGGYWIFASLNFDFQNREKSEQWKYSFRALSVGESLLPALSSEIQAIDWKDTALAPPALRLWLLYVATLMEQTLANFSGTDFGFQSVHNIAFVAQAAQMELSRWEEVQRELSKYLYSEAIGRASRAWFERASEQRAEEERWIRECVRTQYWTMRTGVLDMLGNIGAGNGLRIL
jgi:Fungal specific transcription factor domain